MTTASDKELGSLHKAVAVALQEQVVGYEEETEHGVRVVKPSPALLGAAISFLKNNNITASATDNEELNKLSKALAAKRRGKLPQAALDEAAEHYTMATGFIQ